MVGAVTERRLESLRDLAASKATGADTDALRRSVDHCADTLEVGVEGSFRLVIGVTDVMA
jgi:hypothetical protein